jgi:predicted metalloprotease with PDZ domain
VSQVRRDTPGWHAGLTMDDEILAIDDYRVRPEQWLTRLEQYCPGDTVCLLAARREQLRRFNVTLAARPRPCWTLETHPEASPTQRARLQSWLGLAASSQE